MTGGGVKKCSMCGETKSASEFRKSRAQCKSCYTALVRKYCEQNREKRSAYCRRYHKKNRAREKAYRIEFYRKNKEMIRRRAREATKAAMLKKHNITPEQFADMIAEQNGVCSICGNPETQIRKGRAIKLVLDHCHETGTIRGLLCSRCNLALGAFYDNIDILVSAVSYLRNSKIKARRIG